MLTYNTQQKEILLPEYGRAIQQMVDYCLTLQDRDERTRCAYTIVKTMTTLFSGEQADEESDHKYWDHLALMSNYQLDIDWPYEILRPEEIEQHPEPVTLDTERILARHYGKNLERLIYIAAEMPESEDRWALVTLIASQMKKMMLEINKDAADDEKIFQDLADISGGRILINPDDMPLHEFVLAPSSKKKKK